jgi:hypothetical protein
MPLFSRRKVLACKLEAVPGVAETLANTDAAFNVMDAEMQPNIEFEERPIQGSLNYLRGNLGARGATLTFRTEVYGGASNSATPGWGLFLRGCGMAETSGAFAFVNGTVGNTSTSQRTLTFGLYEDGKRKRMRGAMGSAVLNFPTGRPAFIEWTFQGIWIPPDDQTLLGPTYPSQVPMRSAAIDNATGVTISIGNDAWNACFENMTIDFGNEVVLRPCVNPQDASGYATALITNRRVVGEFNPEALLVGTRDYYAAWLAHNTFDLEYKLSDGVSGVNVKLDNAQIENLQEGDREGMIIDTVSFTQTNTSLQINTGAAV